MWSIILDLNSLKTVKDNESIQTNGKNEWTNQCICRIWEIQKLCETFKKFSSKLILNQIYIK